MLFIHRCWLRSLFGRQGVIRKFLYLVGNSIQNHCNYCRCKITVSMFGTYWHHVPHIFISIHTCLEITHRLIRFMCRSDCNYCFRFTSCCAASNHPHQPILLYWRVLAMGMQLLVIWLSAKWLLNTRVRGCKGREQKVAAISGVVSAPPAAATISASH